MTWNQTAAAKPWSGNTKTWMTELPDETPLQDLSIPGTHDSAALDDHVGSDWFAVYFSDTQRWRIDQQLDAGIRFLDLRVQIMYNHRGLAMYHSGDLIRDPYGSMYDQLYFKTVLQKCVDFLKQNPNETIVVSVKCDGDESYGGWTVEDWFRQIANEVAADNPPGTWDNWWKYPSNVNLTLKDARGKLVLWRRFSRGGKDTTLDYSKPFGLDLTPMNKRYENTTGASWWTPDGGYSYVQDHYTDTTVTQKFDAWQKTATLAWESRRGAAPDDTNRQFINFSSIGAGRYPSTYAKPMNAALATWLSALRTGKSPYDGSVVGGATARSGLGVVPMDYPRTDVISHLIQLNFEPSYSLSDTQAGKDFVTAVLAQVTKNEP